MKNARPHLRFLLLVSTLSMILLVAGVGVVIGIVLRTAPPAASNSKVPSIAELPLPSTPAAWRTYHGDADLRGFVKETLLDQLTIVWRFMAGAPVRQTPVAADGRIFFATSQGEVIAIDRNAQKIWSRKLMTGKMENGAPEPESIDAPLACFAGLVFAGTRDDALYALDAATGDERWRAPVSGSVLGTPNYLPSAGNGAGGSIYVIASGDGVLHCVDAETGAIRWRGESVGRCDACLAVAPDFIGFGSCAAALHIFDPANGKLIRNIEIDEDSQIAGGVAIDGNAVFTGCRSGKVLQVDAKTGQKVWANSDHESEVFSTPAVSDDTVAAADNEGSVFALDRATGKLRWQFDTKGMALSPIIAGDKVIAVADGELFLLSVRDGKKIMSIKVSDEITSPAVYDGLILVGSEDGTVVALGPGENTQTPEAPQ